MRISIEIPETMAVVALRPLLRAAADLGLRPVFVPPSAQPRPGLLEPHPSAAEREARVMGGEA